jgi:hypothetical protein
VLRGVALLASLLLVGLTTPAQARLGLVDACLAVAATDVTAETWTRLRERIEAVAADRTALFPSPSIVAGTHAALSGSAVPVHELAIDAGHGSSDASEWGPGSCLEPGLEWTARFGQPFLQASADRMLLEAQTTPGIESAVDIGWFAAEHRLRTTLVFAGPFDIPNGTCWIDDTLSIDAQAGTAVASGQQGLETSPFAEGACGRFFDHLAEGGAGEQAVTLFPMEVDLPDGGTIRLVATHLSVTDAEIVVGGTLELR